MRRYPLVLERLFARLEGKKLLGNSLVVMSNACILALDLYMFRSSEQIMKG